MKIDFKTLALITKILRYVKKPDDKIKKEILSKAPPEVRDKLSEMMTHYERAQRGEMKPEEAAQKIAEALGFKTTSEAMETLKDLLEVFKEELGEQQDMVSGVEVSTGENEILRRATRIRSRIDAGE